MNKEVKQILKDIYLIDKDLKKQEKMLIKVVQELLSSKPESKIDNNFIQELRLKVIEKEKSLKEDIPKINMFNKIFNKQFGYAFAGMVVVILAMVISIDLFNGEKGDLVINNTDEDNVFIKDIGENAFGEIYFAQEENASDGKTLGLGGGGQEAKGLSEPMSVMPYYLVNYEYIYKGEEFSLDDEKVSVYRESKGASITQGIGNVLNGISLGLIDSSAFKNTKVNSLEIVEDKDFGYSLHINSRDNSISISMNWEKWPQERFNNPPEKMSNEKAIEISDQFMSNYGLNLGSYGPGEVVSNNNDAMILEQVTSENISIVYPLKIEGEVVYDQNGQKTGIYTNVSVRHGRVISAHNIKLNSFDSSEYDAETNKDKIIGAAENGGMYRNYSNPQAKETVTIELGTPTKELVKIWNMSFDKFREDELYVPSLIFPIISNERNVYRTNVIVPLIGEMIE